MKKRLFYTLFFFILLFRCANVKPPKGGPKDTSPPELLEVNPPSKAKNNQPSEIKFTFDEKIQTKGLFNNFYIQPYQKLNYQTTIKNNTLILNIKDTLPKNKTYTLYFKNAISDKTEQNKIPELTYTFSTGPDLDTNKLSGNIKQLKTNKPSSNALVGLYNVTDTLDPEQDKPLYFTYTDKEGNYNLENLEKRNYRIYAFSDNNNDRLYNPNKDIIGWFSDTIKIDTTLNKTNLKLLEQDFKPPEWNKKEVFKNFIDIEFSEKPDTIIIHNSKNPVKNYINLNNLKYRFFLNNPLTDTTVFKFTTYDTKENKKRDSLRLIPPKDKKKPENLTINFLKPETRKIKNNRLNFIIKYNYPVQKINYDSIKIYEDTLQWSKQRIEEYSFFNENKTKWYIKKKDKVKDSIKLIFKKGSFISIYKDTSKKQENKFTFYDKRNFGVIRGKCINVPKNIPYTIELTNENYEVIKKHKNIPEFKFNYLRPGTYYLRGFLDKNNNGKWDQGNYKKFISPEPYFFNNKELQIKANWEIRDVKLNFKENK